MKREPVAQGAFALEPRDRFESIDILRGLALYGVLVVNLVLEFRVPLFQQFLPAPAEQGAAARWAEAFIRNALEMKAFAVFSLLFGFGLALQYERFAANGSPRRWLARRLLVLLGFGLVHLLLVWNGDILTEYALAGLLVLPLLGAPRWVLAAASGLFFAAWLALPHFTALASLPDQAWLAQHVAEAYRVLSAGTLAEVLRFNLHELPYLLPLHLWVFPRTLGLFLLGALIWRSAIIQRMATLRARVASVSLACVAGGLFLSSGAAATVLLALGFAAGVVVALEAAPVRRSLHGFALVGRMAFTNYIMQSLMAGWIFYGYGLAQIGRLNAAEGLALASGIYLLQMWLSRCWLRHYRFGPLEWLWRTLTYGRLQPMKIAPSGNMQASAKMTTNPDA